MFPLENYNYCNRLVTYIFTDQICEVALPYIEVNVSLDAHAIYRLLQEDIKLGIVRDVFSGRFDLPLTAEHCSPTSICCLANHITGSNITHNAYLKRANLRWKTLKLDRFLFSVFNPVSSVSLTELLLTMLGAFLLNSPEIQVVRVFCNSISRQLIERADFLLAFDQVPHSSSSFANTWDFPSQGISKFPVSRATTLQTTKTQNCSHGICSQQLTEAFLETYYYFVSKMPF